MLGDVSELLAVKEKLLACGKHKLFPAVLAFQFSIQEFHPLLPLRQMPHEY
jgi:hypothetical protein